MATHAGGLTARRAGRADPRPAPRSLRRPGRPRRPRPGHRAPASSSRCSGRSGSGKSTLLRALAGLDHDVAGTGADRRARSGLGRLPGLAAAALEAGARQRDPRARAAATRGARAARPWPRSAGRPRAGLAHRAVRRRAAARRAGPLAGPRARAAAGRRAVRRARRADPDADARACCASCATGTGRRCCWSPTTSTRRSCSPTGCSCSTAAGSPSTGASSCRRRDARDRPAFAASRCTPARRARRRPDRPSTHGPRTRKAP